MGSNYPIASTEVGAPLPPSHQVNVLTDQFHPVACLFWR